MQLRDHPLLTVRSICNWPPAWVRLGRLKGKAPKTLTGEIGVLKEVRYYEDRPGRVYLTVDHNGTAYVGCLLLDDQSFCKHAFEHLRRCYGMAIEAVGSSELP
jgi:hypothetical protein